MSEYRPVTGAGGNVKHMGRDDLQAAKKSAVKALAGKKNERATQAGAFSLGILVPGRRLVMKAGAVVALLVAMPVCVGAEDDNSRVAVFEYADFGPQAASWQVLGFEWWQWMPHGDSNPATRYDVKVVVYKDVDLAAVQDLYPLDTGSNRDFRYVAYQKAVDYLERAIAEDVVPSVTFRLRRTLARVEGIPTNKVRREFAMALGVAPESVVSARYWWQHRANQSPERWGAMAGTFMEDGQQIGAVAEVGFCANAQPCVQKGRRLGKATSVVPRFEVDLKGPPRKINLDHFPDVGLINAPAWSAMPALVVRTVWENPEPPPSAERRRGPPATHTVEERYVYLLSLAGSLHVTWLSEWIGIVHEDGSGFEMDAMQFKKGAGDVLDVHMTRQPVLHKRSRCRKPQSHRRIWRFSEHGYREDKTQPPESSGCR